MHNNGELQPSIWNNILILSNYYLLLSTHSLYVLLLFVSTKQTWRHNGENRFSVVLSPLDVFTWICCTSIVVFILSKFLLAMNTFASVFTTKLNTLHFVKKIKSIRTFRITMSEYIWKVWLSKLAHTTHIATLHWKRRDACVWHRHMRNPQSYFVHTQRKWNANFGDAIYLILYLTGWQTQHSVHCNTFLSVLLVLYSNV